MESKTYLPLQEGYIDICLLHGANEGQAPVYALTALLVMEKIGSATLSMATDKGKICMEGDEWCPIQYLTVEDRNAFIQNMTEIGDMLNLRVMVDKEVFEVEEEKHDLPNATPLRGL